MRLPLGRSLLVTTLTTLALFLAPSVVAEPPGEIVIHGADSGSNMTLSTSPDGKRIVVDGLMAHAKPQGCHLLRRTKAVCRVAGHTSVRLVMGSSGDFVRVVDRLPMPLSIYLGDGSDKFIGSGERDTCFPGGARRNRCIGGGGNDVCITGPRNSDCVGGPGDDYCRHGTGSDGCWGGPGDDVCVMGPGMDGCHGEGGNDRLYGGPQPDRLYGGAGHDYCNGGPGWGKSQTCDAGPRR